MDYAYTNDVGALIVDENGALMTGATADDCCCVGDPILYWLVEHCVTGSITTAIGGAEVGDIVYVDGDCHEVLAATTETPSAPSLVQSGLSACENCWSCINLISLGLPTTLSA